MEAIEKAKIILDLKDSSEDIKLETLMSLVEEEALELTGLDTIASISISLLTKMLIFKYRKMGFEAIKNQGYSGISESYSEDYTPDILKALKSYRKGFKCIR